jgi:hypothetical protein
LKKLLKKDRRIAISFQDKDNILMQEYERTHIERKTHVYKVFAYSLQEVKDIADKVGLEVVQNNRAGIQLHVLLKAHTTEGSRLSK